MNRYNFKTYEFVYKTKYHILNFEPKPIRDTVIIDVM
jgi:hypothetical protein